MTDRMINNRVKQLRELESQHAQLEAQIADLKNMLKAELSERKTDSFETKFYRVFYSTYTKKVVDSDKLKKAGLYDKYSKAQIVRPFKIADVTAAS